MLHILLLILKILGITLLALLLLVLLIILLVLFVPVRYKGKGSYFEALQLKGNASWLLHLVHFSFAYEEETPKWKLRICGIPIKRSEDSVSSLEEDRDGSLEEKENLDSSMEEDRGSSMKDEDENASKKWEQRSTGIQLAGDDELTEEEQQGNKEVISKDSEPTEENVSLWEKLKSFFLKIKEKASGFLEKLKSLKEKVSDIIEKIRFFWQWWNLETTKLAVAHCKEELWILLKHIAPCKYNVDLRFGTGDPATTGQILGVIGIIYPVTKGQLRITPEFQEKLIEGTFDLKGRIYVYKLLAIAWRVFWDRNVREAYATWQQRATT